MTAVPLSRSSVTDTVDDNGSSRYGVFFEWMRNFLTASIVISSINYVREPLPTVPIHVMMKGTTCQRALPSVNI
jgi:hypothetical protein